MRRCWLLGLLLICGTVHAREYFSTELTFTLFTEDVRNQRPTKLGLPLQRIYYFSDDGEVVWENNSPQYGVNLLFEHAPNELSSGKLKAAFHVTALASVVEMILTSDESNRVRALSFLALSLSHVIPMELVFDAKTSQQTSFYQFHSPYRGQEESSYHLVVTFSRPTRALH